MSNLKPKSKKEFEQTKNNLLNILAYSPTEQINNPQDFTSLYYPTIKSVYPNPFNPTTTISFSLPYDSQVVLSIYNIKGQKIKTIMKNCLKSGQHNIVWDGQDESGKHISSGIYFGLLETPDFKTTKKMILIK